MDWEPESGPVSPKTCRLVARTVWRSLGQCTPSCSQALQTSFHRRLKTSLLGIVPCEGMLSLLNLLILLSLVLSAPPGAPRFLGSCAHLSSCNQHRARTTCQVTGWSGCSCLPQDKSFLESERGPCSRSLQPVPAARPQGLLAETPVLLFILRCGQSDSRHFLLTPCHLLGVPKSDS